MSSPLTSRSLEAVVSRFVLATIALAALAGAASAQPVAGRWSGYWISDKDGHTGPLHVRLRPTGDGEYRAAFHGRFAGVVPFWYTTKFRATGCGGETLLLEGSQRLPLFGEYKTSAVVTAESFEATYTARNDFGRFVLTGRR
jgi:hypothetical protein